MLPRTSLIPFHSLRGSFALAALTAFLMAATSAEVRADFKPVTSSRPSHSRRQTAFRSHSGDARAKSCSIKAERA
jgi:hypothetical protein